MCSRTGQSMKKHSKLFFGAAYRVLFGHHCCPPFVRYPKGIRQCTKANHYGGRSSIFLQLLLIFKAWSDSSPVCLFSRQGVLLPKVAQTILLPLFQRREEVSVLLYTCTTIISGVFHPCVLCSVNAVDAEDGVKACAKHSPGDESPRPIIPNNRAGTRGGGGHMHKSWCEGVLSVFWISRLLRWRLPGVNTHSRTCIPVGASSALTNTAVTCTALFCSCFYLAVLGVR